MPDRHAIPRALGLITVAAAMLLAAACRPADARPTAAAPGLTGSPSAETGDRGAPAGATATARALPRTFSSSTTIRTGRLTVTITGLPANPALALGGAPLQFTVTVSNGTNQTYSDIAPIVALGHCTCNDSPMPVAPNGTLQQLSAAGSWRTFFLDHIGGGTDFLNVLQQEPFTLAPGTSRGFTFRISLAAGQMGFHAGTTSITVTMIQLPARLVIIGAGPAATATVTVTTG